jgi:hypothetical protein
MRSVEEIEDKLEKLYEKITPETAQKWTKIERNKLLSYIDALEWVLDKDEGD